MVHSAILRNYNKAYKAARSGDLATFKSGRDGIAANALIPFIQARRRVPDGTGVGSQDALPLPLPDPACPAAGSTAEVVVVVVVVDQEAGYCAAFASQLVRHSLTARFAGHPQGRQRREQEGGPAPERRHPPGAGNKPPLLPLSLRGCCPTDVLSGCLLRRRAAAACRMLS